MGHVDVTNGVTTWYGEISRQWIVPDFGGLMGTPSTSSDDDALVLDDLKQREKYINLLELSRNPECVVAKESFDRLNRGSFRKTEIITPATINAQCSSGEASVNHGHVVVMMSLSEESIDMTPFDIMETFVTALQSSAKRGTQYSLVSYDGDKQWYQPFFVTMNGHIMGNAGDLQTAIDAVEFNGPSYDEANTKEALGSVAEILNASPAALRKIVVFAPDIDDLESVMGSEVANTFKEHLTDVYFVTNTDLNEVEDAVYNTRQMTQLASKINRDMKKTLRKGVTCNCQDDKTTCTCNNCNNM